MCKNITIIVRHRNEDMNTIFVNENSNVAYKDIIYYQSMIDTKLKC